jgi:hypothetical protein
VERQHGSSEKESPAQRQQGGPQRFSAQGSAHTRAEEGSPEHFRAQGRSQAPIVPFFRRTKNEKAGALAGFFAFGDHRE